MFDLDRGHAIAGTTPERGSIGMKCTYKNGMIKIK
jgi:hypothetical protein